MFTLIAQLDTIQVTISLATQKSLKIYELDVKSAFLHREINEEVFVEQPLDYEQKGENPRYIVSKRHYTKSSKLHRHGTIE